MFKKPVKVSAQNQLSGKDRKTIKNKLAALFDEESLDVLFTKNDKIICNKISGGKMLIYISDEYPLFVDGTGKQDFFPSIYVCAAYEPFSKSITINQGVQNFIFNGANLMWPGVRDFSGLGNFKKDQVVSIKNIKNQIIGVGALGCSLDQLKKNPDGSGIAVYILHVKGDKLWQMGAKQYPQVIVKSKEVKVEEKKVEQAPKEEVKQQPKQKQGQKQKKQKKQQKAPESDQQQPEQKPKGKGKKNKEKQVKQKNQQIKAAVKKPEPQPQSDDDDLDFGAMVHNNKKQKPQIVMEKKKVVVNFSDDQDDKKGKKKNKKGGKKKEEAQEEQQHVQPQKKPKHKQSSDVEQEPVKKQKGKKGKGKKGGDDEEEKIEIKKEEPKKKQGKKQKKKEESESQKEEEQQQQKPQKGKKKQQEQKNVHQQGKSAINSQLMDDYFKQAFLNALKLSKVQAELPIDSGRFFSDYMLLARSEGIKLEIKDSSYKKLGKFYEEMAKQKLIDFKPAKEKKGQQGSTITKIHWENEELKNYFPTIKRMGEKDVEEKEEVYSKQKLKLSKTVQVDTVYKLNDELKNVLLKKTVNYMPANSDEEAQQENNKKDVYLTEKQLKEKIEKFINEIAVKEQKQVKQKEGKEGKQGKQGKEGKQKKVQKLITLSYKDNKFIYQLLKSEIEQYQQNIQKEQIMAQHNSDQEQKKQKKKDKNKRNFFRIDRGYIVNKVMKLAHSYYSISDPETGLNKFREGVFKGIQLIADKVINKNVTKIIGLQTFIPSNTPQEEIVKQIHGFSQSLQLKFASSSNVQNLPGKNAGKQIILQGNFVDELQAIFIQEYGIKKEYITIQNKLGKKKKN